MEECQYRFPHKTSTHLCFRSATKGLYVDMSPLDEHHVSFYEYYFDHDPRVSLLLLSPSSQCRIPLLLSSLQLHCIRTKHYLIIHSFKQNKSNETSRYIQSKYIFDVNLSISIGVMSNVDEIRMLNVCITN